MNNIVNNKDIEEQYYETIQEITNYLTEIINKGDKKYPRLIRKQRDKIKRLLKFLTKIVERSKTFRSITKEEKDIWQKKLEGLEKEFKSWKLKNLSDINPKNTSKHAFFNGKERAPVGIPRAEVNSSYFPGKVH